MLYICYINTIPNWRFILGFPTSTITVTVTQTHCDRMHWATGQAPPDLPLWSAPSASRSPRNRRRSLARWTTSWGLSMTLMGTGIQLPSGYVKIAIENGPFIVDFPLKMVIFHSYVSLPEASNNMIWVYMGWCWFYNWEFNSKIWQCWCGNDDNRPNVGANPIWLLGLHLETFETSEESWVSEACQATEQRSTVMACSSMTKVTRPGHRRPSWPHSVGDDPSDLHVSNGSWLKMVPAMVAMRQVWSKHQKAKQLL